MIGCSRSEDRIADDAGPRVGDAQSNGGRHNFEIVLEIVLKFSEQLPIIFQHSWSKIGCELHDAPRESTSEESCDQDQRFPISDQRVAMQAEQARETKVINITNEE